MGDADYGLFWQGIMRSLLPVAFVIIALTGRDLAQEANSAGAPPRNLITHGLDDGSLAMPEGKTDTPVAPELLPESSAIPMPSPPAPGVPTPKKISEERHVSLANSPVHSKHQRDKGSHRLSRAGHTRFSHSALARRGKLHSGARVNLQHRSVRRDHRTHRTRRHVVVYEYVNWGP
jgi:hypothetical protein